MIPKRKKRERMNVRESSVIRCQSHLKWVRGHECCIAGRTLLPTRSNHRCQGRMEAHHVTTRGAGGGDETAVPLCSDAHKRVHDMGIASFQLAYRVDLNSIAAQLWQASPHGQKWRREHDG